MIVEIKSANFGLKLMAATCSLWPSKQLCVMSNQRLWT